MSTAQSGQPHLSRARMYIYIREGTTTRAHPSVRRAAAVFRERRTRKLRLTRARARVCGYIAADRGEGPGFRGFAICAHACKRRRRERERERESLISIEIERMGFCVW